jgi:alkanesulfonate monooxygenase SsuD/methylene tetrahydromethanopterin reductase-like flavin-dependent oxidoreductase (luciferase family)
MLRLTGRLADGLFVSMPYVPPAELGRVNGLIDDGAKEAGRSPDAIRRGYNVSGAIRPGEGSVRFSGEEGKMEGTAGYWVEQLSELYREYGMDTFIFWGGGAVGEQIERFAKEVVPGVKEAVAAIAN